MNNSPRLDAIDEKLVSKIQTKFLGVGVNSSTGEITALTFNNLIIGNWYEFKYYIYENATGSLDGTIQNGSEVLGQVSHGSIANNSRTLSGWFQATGVTLRLVLTNNGVGLFGTGDKGATYAQIKEIVGEVIETADFT